MLKKLSGKECYNPLYKYITHDKFIEYCRANNVYVDEKTMETYEKLGLLFPIYRFIIPKDYIRSICNENINNIDPILNLHPEWKQIEKLHESLNTYTAPLEKFFRRTLMYGNPLDYSIKQKHPFLIIPNKANFKPWRIYKVKIKNKNNYKCKNEEDIANHYYAHWQIFVLNELNEMYTEQTNILTKQKDMSYYGNKFKEVKKLSPSKINDYAQYFQIVSNYAMFEHIITGFIIQKNENKQFLSKENYNFYTKEKKKIAKKEYKKNSYDKWMEFIKNLYVLYEKYLKDEKIKLSNEVKRFLSFTINLLITAKNLTFEKLNEDFIAGYRTFTRKLRNDIYIIPTGLEKIFPSEINELKREAYLKLPCLIKELNKIFPMKEQLPENFHEKIITTIIDEEYGTLFSHLYKIEDIWFNREKFATPSLIAHLRSLIVSIEDVGILWFGGNRIDGMLKKAFKEYEKLQKKYSRYERKITEAKTTKEFINKANIILNQKEFSSKDRLCGYYLVLTSLARNFFSHRNKIMEELLGNIFLEVYKSAMFTLICLYRKKEDIIDRGGG